MMALIVIGLVSCAACLAANLWLIWETRRADKEKRRLAEEELRAEMYPPISRKPGDFWVKKEEK